MMTRTFGVAGGAADGLNQARLAAEKALFVGVEDGHKADLGQVEALTQQVDAHHHVDGAEAESLMISIRSRCPPRGAYT